MFNLKSISYGRLDKFDEILQNEFVLRAVAFGKNNDEKSYKEILVNKNWIKVSS